ncbi:MAG: hypothetical protein OEM29_02310 [Thermoplasmata archaeon]|nr:hypothetical protein [Thermoplasmata archaeon]
MFSLRKRKDKWSIPDSPVEFDAPVHRMCEEAFGHRGPRQEGATDKALRAESRNMLLKADMKPLSRRPSFATAGGNAQRGCHYCGRGLRETS